MLRHVFENHQPSNPIEQLVKSAAIGDLGSIEEVTKVYLISHMTICHMIITGFVSRSVPY